MTDSDLEARLNTYERDLRRLLDIREIQNLMGRRAYYVAAARHDLDFSECWSRECEDISAEFEEWGVWEGREAVYDSYVRYAPRALPGWMIEHTLTTDVIEIAGDGQTAKGVWLSPGHETFPLPGSGDTPVAQWCWNRYGVDFIREGGEWKVWHLHVYSVFRVPYGTDWVTASINPPEYIDDPLLLPDDRIPAPTRPKTFNQNYALDAPMTTEPKPPLPYATFSETWSYTDTPPEHVAPWSS